MISIPKTFFKKVLASFEIDDLPRGEGCPADGDNFAAVGDTAQTPTRTGPSKQAHDQGGVQTSVSICATNMLTFVTFNLLISRDSN